MPAEPDYARIAYEAWCAHHLGTHLNGDLILPWESQPQAIKDAWKAAVGAAFQALRPDEAP